MENPLNKKKIVSQQEVFSIYGCVHIKQTTLVSRSGLMDFLFDISISDRFLHKQGVTGQTIKSDSFKEGSILNYLADSESTHLLTYKVTFKK